jgi:hypothetical protein
VVGAAAPLAGLNLIGKGDGGGGVIHGWGSISCTVSGRSFSWGGPLLPAATAVSVMLVLIGIGEGNIPIGGSSKNVQARWGCHEGSFL